MTNLSHLSTAAQTALINASGGSRRGAVIPTTTDPKVTQELANAGLVGAGNGLTDSGATARVRLINDRMEQF